MFRYGPFEPDLVHTSGGKWRYLLLSLYTRGRFLLFLGSGLFIFPSETLSKGVNFMSIRKLTVMALLVAIAVAGSTFVSIPTGVARAYPVQHTINVVGAILLGPVPTVIIAFVTAIIRILTGTGSLLAIPGSVVGALCAALAYRYSSKMWLAGIGEIIGTGILASLIAVPYAKLLMGTSVAAFFFIPAFLTSSTIGALLGVVIANSLRKTVLVKNFNSSLY